MTLPPLASREEILRRLKLIFPEGAPNRAYCTRDTAASTVFVALYVGAVEGSGCHFSPKQVYRMGQEQAELTTDASRIEYATQTLVAGSKPRGTTWYADTSREQIRDETLRNGLLPVGAVVDRKDIPTTSAKPRYAITASFAALFDPSLEEGALEEAISRWQEAHLKQGALNRIALLRAGISKSPTDFIVTFPNGETRNLTPGTSSMISKHVVEAFAPRFLEQPGVLWLSESGNKVVQRDDVLARRIGLKIDVGRHLPDIILVDLGGPAPLLVFVEVVATDGSVTEERRADLMKLATNASVAEEDVVFVTAFLDRTELRRAVAKLAWSSFAWTASEPENLIALVGGGPSPTLLRHWLLPSSQRSFS